MDYREADFDDTVCFTCAGPNPTDELEGFCSAACWTADIARRARVLVTGCSDADGAACWARALLRDVRGRADYAALVTAAGRSPAEVIADGEPSTWSTAVMDKVHRRIVRLLVAAHGKEMQARVEPQLRDAMIRGLEGEAQRWGIMIGGASTEAMARRLLATAPPARVYRSRS